jgi:hypothetical protein
MDVAIGHGFLIGSLLFCLFCPFLLFAPPVQENLAKKTLNNPLNRIIIFNHEFKSVYEPIDLIRTKMRANHAQ